jgi:hypothetical protein
MRKILTASVMVLATLSSCSKKESAQSAPLSPEQEAAIESQYVAPANQPAPESAAPTPTQTKPAQRAQPAQPRLQERINGRVQPILTQLLRAYVKKTGRMPETFTEFMYGTMDSAPLAPEGMKFVIDPADQSVKVVKK